MAENQYTTIPLESERLILRPLRKEDAAEMFSNWASDPDVTKYVAWSTHSSVDETVEFLACVEKETDSPNSYNWGLVIRDTGELIGSIGVSAQSFVHIDDGIDRHEIGYCLAKKHWNKGYASEALIRVFAFLRDDIGLRHFSCGYDVRNPASGAVMRKIGFMQCGREKKTGFDGVKQMDCLIFKLDLPE
jgi:ribosomal-protein-alanine N-acetyltransferase